MTTSRRLPLRGRERCRPAASVPDLFRSDPHFGDVSSPADNFFRWSCSSWFSYLILRSLCGATNDSRGVHCRLGRLQRYANVIHAVIDLVIGPDEHIGEAEHGPVRREYLAGEGFDPPTLRPLGEPGEERLPYALRLPAVFHDDRHLGFVVIPEPRVHGVADDLLFRYGYERLFVEVICAQHHGHHPLRDLRLRYVEPSVDGLSRRAGEHLAQLLAVMSCRNSDIDLRRVHCSLLFLVNCDRSTCYTVSSVAHPRLLSSLICPGCSFLLFVDYFGRRLLRSPAYRASSQFRSCTRRDLPSWFGRAIPARRTSFTPCMISSRCCRQIS